MLTAAITAAIGWILFQFGIKPGPYLGLVALGVKIIIVLVGVLLGAKVIKKARAKQGQPDSPAEPGPPPGPA